MENEIPLDSELVSVKTVGSEIEADVYKSALEEAGFTVMVRTFEDSAYDGLFVKQQGWGHIEVAEEDRDGAGAIVKEVESTYEGEE